MLLTCRCEWSKRPNRYLLQLLQEEELLACTRLEMKWKKKKKNIEKHASNPLVQPSSSKQIWYTVGTVKKNKRLDVEGMM